MFYLLKVYTLITAIVTLIGATALVMALLGYTAFLAVAILIQGIRRLGRIKTARAPA
jgi:hypothetical protein